MNSCETTVYLLMCTASFFLSPGHLWASTWQVCAQAEQRAEVSQTASRLPQRLCFGWHWTEEGNQVTGIDTERLGWLFKVLLLQLLLGCSTNYCDHTYCCIHTCTIYGHTAYCCVHVHTESSVDVRECGEEEGMPKTTFESKRYAPIAC